MRNVFTYPGLFLVGVVVMQLFVFDSMRISVWFSPLVYVAFVILLPVNMRPLAVVLLGFATGAVVDFFEGTPGLHTAATLLSAYIRRPVMMLTLGRDVVEEGMGMPSVKSLGAARFLRYAALSVTIHCLACFSLEALSWANFHHVLMKTVVSGGFTLLGVWAVSLLFTIKTPAKI
jgi:rod shape-determining protein MreD